MLYFFLDTKSKLLTSFNTVISPTQEVYCPFCHARVLPYNPFDQSVTYYAHAQETSCNPTFIEQLFFYFVNFFPASVDLTLPAFDHSLDPITVFYPNFPEKYFIFPSKIHRFDESKLTIIPENLAQIDYPSHGVISYHYINSGHNYILIFNFFEEEVNKDIFDERLFYSSTVLEINIPDGLTHTAFRFGITIQKLFDVLSIRFLRNEVLIDEIQKYHASLKSDYEIFVKQQSDHLRDLSEAGIIKLRRQ